MTLELRESGSAISRGGKMYVAKQCLVFSLLLLSSELLHRVHHVIARSIRRSLRKLHQIRQLRLLTCTKVGGNVMADSSKEHKLISSEAAESLSSEYIHAAHVMLYAPQPAKLFGKYDQKYVILVR